MTTLVAFICVLTDTYGDYQIRPDVAFPYLTFVDNASQVRSELRCGSKPPLALLSECCLTGGPLAPPPY